MIPRLATVTSRGRVALAAGPVLALAGLPAALAIGVAAGSPIPEFQIAAMAAVGLLAVAVAALWPWVAIQVLLFSVFFLIVYLVTGTRAANAIDVFLIPVLLVGLVGGARARMRREMDALEDPRHAGLRRATGRLARATGIFYAVAAGSLVLQALRGRPDWALDSALPLVRALQGVSFFALGYWWFRTEDHLRIALRSLEVAAWAMLAVNVFFFATEGISRAGQCWIVNNPEWPMTSPNDAGVTLLFVWAMLQAVPAREKTFDRRLLMAGLLVMLVMTQSRSGLLAWGVYNLLTVRWFRWRTLAAVVGLAVLAASFVPETYWGRISKTIAIDSGSFEAYTSLIRVYGWQAAVRVFLEHPLTGVGYLGFRFISAAYNELSIVIGPAESYYLEVAADMGIVGLAALAFALIALWRLGTAARAAAPPGSFGHELARRHGPLMLALYLVNLTGNNFVGLVLLGQLSIWCAMMVRAAHLGIEGGRR